jgi:membrane protein insertase Oxa1/YidC/SpoIIIJ
MFIMIIVMGFSLPSAMGIYWFIGALISLAQTLLTRRFLGGMKK